MYLLSDDDMVSHCYWKDDEHIIAFENKHGEGTGYYLMKDKTGLGSPDDRAVFVRRTSDYVQPASLYER